MDMADWALYKRVFHIKTELVGKEDMGFIGADKKICFHTFAGHLSFGTIAFTGSFGAWGYIMAEAFLTTATCSKNTGRLPV